jgi:hypothetical protein
MPEHPRGTGMPQWVIAACQFLQAQFHEVRAIDTAPASDSTRLVRINIKND